MIYFFILLLTTGCITKSKTQETSSAEVIEKDSSHTVSSYEKTIINGGPIPPPGYEQERRPVVLPKPDDFPQK